MRKLRFFLLLAVFTVVPVAVWAVDPSPSPLPTATAQTATLPMIWDWIMSHQIILGGLMASIFDFLFALNPKWKSNGVVHFLYLWARKKAGLPDPVPSS